MNSTLPRGSFKNCLGENFNIIEFKVQCYEHENLGNFPDNLARFQTGNIGKNILFTK